MPANFGIMVHGGAGTTKIRKFKEGYHISKALGDSVIAGYDLLKSGHQALDGVEDAVAHMEDSGLFNAGVGSCLTLDKGIEMDASIMNGKDLSAGSVGMVQNIRNPVRLARQVMERTDHVMLVSDGAFELAKLVGIRTERLVADSEKLESYKRLRKDMRATWSKNYQLLSAQYGTVGAVALDKHGNVAAAVSTGGRWFKLHGRIGDSAVIGAGIYADNRSGAVCATGSGELMMRMCLSKYACDLLKRSNPSHSANKAIGLLTKKFGANTGGIIAIDTKCRFGMSTNTKSMPVAMKSSEDEKTRVHFEKEW